MSSHIAAQILQAMKNHRRRPQTIGAKIKRAIEHAQQSPLQAMLELERQRRAHQTRGGKS